MKRGIHVLIFLLFLTTLLLTSCAKMDKISTDVEGMVALTVSNENVKTSPKKVSRDTIIITTLKDSFDYNDVQQFINDGNDMNAFFERFNVEFYKETEIFYDTFIKTNNGYLWVSFFKEREIQNTNGTIFKNEEGKFASCSLLYFSPDSIEEKILNVEIGTSVDKVKNIDSNISFITVYSSDVKDLDGTSYISQTKSNSISKHYFIDGTAVQIRYDEEWKVKELKVFYL